MNNLSKVDYQNSLEDLLFAIDMSEGEFKPIKVLCNYRSLQRKILDDLTQIRPDILILTVPTNTTRLYSVIRDFVGDSKPPALMIVGLESVRNIDQLLTVMNQRREDFKRDFLFPLFLWVDDEIVKKLIKLAPDIESLMSITIFRLTPDNLYLFVQELTEKIFTGVLADGARQFRTNNDILGEHSQLELASALRDLENNNQALEPELQASLEFISGREQYIQNHYDRALKHYQQSLEYLAAIADPKSSSKDKQAVILFHIGLCYYDQNLKNKAETKANLEQAKQYFQESLEIWEGENQPELVAKFITKLEEVWEQLKIWQDLKQVAQKAEILHQKYGNNLQLAQDYGFLATVALQEKEIHQARDFAEKARREADLFEIALLNKSPNDEQEEITAWLLLIFAQVKVELGLIDEAIAELNQAKSKSHVNPQLYLEILEELRTLYLNKQLYLEAFQVKQERLSVKQRYGLTAFIGPGILKSKLSGSSESVAEAIAASGREIDVKNLIARIGNNEDKLTVICGESGVGKSSLLQGGLIPALEQQKIIGDRTLFVVSLRMYNELEKQLAELLRADTKDVAESKYESFRLKRLHCPLNPPILGDFEAPVPPIIGGLGGQNHTSIQQYHTKDGRELGKNLTRAEYLAGIKQQLEQNNQEDLLTVLIFDQFEEFFFAVTDLKQRREFWDFLGDILNLQWVKVILSLREDYIHYLLPANRLDKMGVINNDILSKAILYTLGNFTSSEAKQVIHQLTERSLFRLTDDLIEQLVKDLAEVTGEVRPIELQIVGAQLQRKNIQTLPQYKKLGKQPQESLVQQYLDEVVQDCGDEENQEVAKLVLYLLTDENNTRPLKTKAELENELESLAIKRKDIKKSLDLVLEILVLSGLVFLVPEQPVQQYQLVHDYLVDVIRKQRAITAKNQAILALSESSKDDYLLHKYSLNPLLEALKAGVKLQEEKEEIKPGPRILALTMLQQGVYGGKIKERNRLVGHKLGLVSVAWSPDGETIASAGWDRSIKLWSKEGKLLHTLSEHQDGVMSVAWSPDGETLASASKDSTIKLWSKEGKLLHTLSGHQVHNFSGRQGGVLSVAWSADGETLASASKDSTIKLWNKEGKLLHTLSEHQDGVMSVAWSPDGETLASASKDSTIKLWSKEGKLLQTISGHQDSVNSVAWSPDGETLASAGWDRRIKLWSKEGKLLHILPGHQSGFEFNSIAWSADGKTLVSASLDRTIQLFSKEGILLHAITGHQSEVNSVAWSADGKTLASASLDRTIKLWSEERKQLHTLSGHQDWVSSVAWSADGETLASASWDRSIKLWSKEKKLLHTLSGHQSSVRSVAWSADGKTLASASTDRSIKLWSKKGKLLHNLSGHQDSVRSVAWSVDGETLASASDDRTIKLWSKEGKLLQTISGHQDSVRSVAWSVDGETLASASLDKTIKLWSKEGKLLYTLSRHQGPAYSVAWSTDGETLASASLDKTIKLWSKEGKLLYTLSRHQGPVYSVAWSADGKILASAGKDRTIILWNFDLEDLLVQGCDWVRDYLTYSAEVSESDRHLCDGI